MNTMKLIKRINDHTVNTCHIYLFLLSYKTIEYIIVNNMYM